VVGLSGNYDLSERSTDAGNQFINDVENYTYTVSPLAQWNVSPVANISTSTNPIPMYLVSAQYDNMPPSEMYWFWNALTNAGLDMTNIRFWTIPGNDSHAFGYWDDPILDEPQPLQAAWWVRDRVIGFFKQYLPQ
jgi:hypothetical protein